MNEFWQLFGQSEVQGNSGDSNDGGLSPLGNVLVGTSNLFDAIDGFMTDRSVDVVYKALAFCGALWLLFFLPATRSFALWAGAAFLLILMLQSQPNAAALSPASSTLPLPTQINTPVPGQGGSAQQAGSGSGSGSGGGNWLATAGEIASVALAFL